jgi:hypothetical protein
MTAATLAGLCTECLDADPEHFTRSSRKLGLCHHCEPVNPRWRDWHTLPDERLLRPVQKWFYRRKRVDPDGRVQYPLRLRWLVILMACYSLRHFHCPLDGQCVFRARHRGGCCWGNDDDD